MWFLFVNGLYFRPCLTTSQILCLGSVLSCKHRHTSKGVWGGPINGRYISRDLMQTSKAIMIGRRETPDPVPGQVKAKLFIFITYATIE